MTRIVAFDPQSPSAAIDEAVAVLRAGGLVAFPTETVYGLGADASNDDAVRKIFVAKGRPAEHPLIVHLAGADQLSDWAREIPAGAQRIAEALWPGPVTLVLKKQPHVSELITGGGDSIGIRVPAHPVAQRLLRAFAGGIAAPSANRFGRISPTTAAHVAEGLSEQVELVIDGGPCEVGIESTIVDFSQLPAVVLRPGQLTLEALRDVAGVEVVQLNKARTLSPGQHPQHYAPKAKVVACPAEQLRQAVDREVQTGRRVLVLAWQAAAESKIPVDWWQWPADLRQVAHDLYAVLHEVDRLAYDTVVMEIPPESGTGVALADRIRRAAGQG